MSISSLLDSNGLFKRSYEPASVFDYFVTSSSQINSQSSYSILEPEQNQGFTQLNTLIRNRDDGNLLVTSNDLSNITADGQRIYLFGSRGTLDLTGNSILMVNCDNTTLADEQLAILSDNSNLSNGADHTGDICGESNVANSQSGNMTNSLFLGSTNGGSIHSVSNCLITGIGGHAWTSSQCAKGAGMHSGQSAPFSGGCQISMVVRKAETSGTDSTRFNADGVYDHLDTSNNNAYFIRIDGVAKERTSNNMTAFEMTVIANNVSGGLTIKSQSYANVYDDIGLTGSNITVQAGVDGVAERLGITANGITGKEITYTINIEITENWA